MVVKVKNLHGTSDNAPLGYTTWKDFWIAKSGMKWPYYCQRYGCYGRAEVGAHVKLADGSNKWYIIPLCSKDNHSEEEFYVNADYLVPVN